MCVSIISRTFVGSVGVCLDHAGADANALQPLDNDHEALVDTYVLLLVLHHARPLTAHLVDNTCRR